MEIYQNIELDKVYKAEHDTTVVAQLDATNKGRAVVEIIMIDSNDNEYRMATASVHFYVQSDVFVLTNTATTLIKKGERYKVVLDQGYPSTTAHAYSRV